MPGAGDRKILVGLDHQKRICQRHVITVREQQVFLVAGENVEAVLIGVLADQFIDPFQLACDERLEAQLDRQDVAGADSLDHLGLGHPTIGHAGGERGGSDLGLGLREYGMSKSCDRQESSTHSCGSGSSQLHDILCCSKSRVAPTNDKISRLPMTILNCPVRAAQCGDVWDIRATTKCVVIQGFDTAAARCCW